MFRFGLCFSGAVILVVCWPKYDLRPWRCHITFSVTSRFPANDFQSLMWRYNDSEHERNTAFFTIVCIIKTERSIWLNRCRLCCQGVSVTKTFMLIDFIFDVLSLVISYRLLYSASPANAPTGSRNMNYPAVSNTWFIFVPRISLFFVTVTYFSWNTLCHEHRLASRPVLRYGLLVMIYHPLSVQPFWKQNEIDFSRDLSFR